MDGWHILLGQYAGVLAIATHHCHTSLPHINQSFGYLPRDISKEQHWLQCRSLACKQKVTVDCQTRAGNSCKEFPSWERCDGRFPNRHSQKHDFYRVLLFALSRQELSSTRTMLLKRNFRNIIVKLQNGGIVIWRFYVLSLVEDFDLTTKRPLAKDFCICESSGTSIVAYMYLSFCRVEVNEIMKSYFICTGMGRTIRWCVWSFYF